ncbi:MAG: hypothetical protein Q9228_006849, partial [Teloschistes exilis]
MHLPTILISLLPLLAHALPTTETQENNIRRTRSFILTSHVLSPANPAFESLVLEPYHIDPVFNYATLWQTSAQNQGVKGFLNGTKQQLDGQQGYLAFDFGRGGIYGFRI